MSEGGPERPRPERRHTAERPPELERRRSPGRRREDAPLAQVAFADAFVALNDGILLTGTDGRIVTANPASFRLLGEENLVGEMFEDLLLVSGATRVQQREGHLVRRAWFPREDRMGVLEIVTTPLPGDRAAHTIRDVTAQAELLRLKEEFLMEVAHELRTPISALIASLDLVVEDALTMPRDELARLAQTLRRSGLRLEHLVENLLDAGSIEAGTFQVRATPSSLKHTLAEALAFVQPMLESRGQRLTTELPPDADRVMADERRTTQVLANLISNASKYAPEGTQVSIRARNADGFVRVTVADEGPGIPQDEQNRLFQRFFRSRTVREEAGGLGLGLAICKAIVHAHGGEISIESSPGNGTSVHFTLPKARQMAEEAED
jgi:signal transduction histidine kinase